MLNNSIALNPTSEALSSADFKKSPETAVIDFKGKTQYYNPFKLLEDSLQQAQKKRSQDIEAEAEKEFQQQQRAIRQAFFEEKMLEAHNLKLAYALLAGKKDKIELITDFNQKNFLKIVTKYLCKQDFDLLTSKVKKMSQELEDELQKIKSCDDPNLYYKYHRYDPKHERFSCNSNGGVEVDYGADLPTAELLNMETESLILSDLADQLNYIAEDREEQQLETIIQALEA